MMRHWRRDIGTEIVADESLAGLVTDECRAEMCLMCISNGDVAAASTRARGLLALRPSASGCEAPLLTVEAHGV